MNVTEYKKLDRVSAAFIGGGGFKFPWLAGAGSQVMPLVDVVGGNSSGILTAFMLAIDDIAALVDFALTQPKVLSRKHNTINILRALISHREAVSDLEPLKKLIISVLNQGAMFKKRCYAGITDIQTGENFVVDLSTLGDEEQIANNMIASCAIPAAMKTMNFWADGGLTNNFPSRKMIGMERKIDKIVTSAYYITSAPLHTQVVEIDELNSVTKMASRGIGLVLHQLMLRDIVEIQRENEFLNELGKDVHIYKDGSIRHLLNPLIGIHPESYLVHMLESDTTRKQRKVLFDEGVRVANKALNS